MEELRSLGVDDLLNHPEVPDVVDGLESYKIHPLVAHSLNKMGGELKDLEASKSVAETDQQKLAEVRDEASSKMSQGAALKSSMSRTEATIGKLEAKLRHLGGEGARVESDRNQLERTLQNVMEPKINNAEVRLEKRKKSAGELQRKADAWAEKQGEYKANAIKQLNDRRSNADALQAADDSIVKAEQAQRTAQEQYEQARKVARESVEEFRYVETRYQATEGKLKELETDGAQEEKSLGKLRSVLQFEAHRLDEAEAAKKERLHELIQATEKKEEGEEREMSSLKARFSDWSQSERERAEVVAKRQHAYDSALGTYQDRHADVFAKAEASAAQRANRDADWGSDDWAWSGGSDAASDPQDEEVPVE